MQRRRVEWALFGVVCVVAVGRAVIASAPAESTVADDATKRAAYKTLVAAEPDQRRDAAKGFPTDIWSQDDAFHEKELGAARTFAQDHRVRLLDVFAAIDEGMREGWPRTTTAPPIATVPPCQPRTIYQ